MKEIKRKRDNIISDNDNTLNWELDKNGCLPYQETNLGLVNHVRICGTQFMNDFINYFPNVTEVTFDKCFDVPNGSIAITLNRIFPLSQITKLIIECFKFPFKQLINLLCSTVNIHSLTLRSTTIEDTEYELIQQDKSFQMVSNTNIIKNLIIDECCKFKKIQLFVTLCPRLQKLTSGMYRKDFLSIARLLLAKTDNNNNIRYLYFLCVLDAPKVSLTELKKFIKLGKLLDDFSINHVDRKLYLWW